MFIFLEIVLAILAFFALTDCQPDIRNAPPLAAITVWVGWIGLVLGLVALMVVLWFAEKEWLCR